MDGDEGLVSNLLQYIWKQGNNGDDKAFLEPFEDFFDRVARVPSCTLLALVYPLLGHVGGTLVGAQVVDGDLRTVGGPVGSCS